MKTVSALVDVANNLPPVSLESAAEYHKNIPSMTKHVDESLTTVSDINTLLGDNPLRIMYDNHKNHAAFMSTVFSINNYELLVRTVVWVYRSYHAHGFSYDYFPVELKSWMKAVELTLDQESAREINTIYSWILENHPHFIELSKNVTDEPAINDKEWIEAKNMFQASLLLGDHKACLKMADKLVRTLSDLEPFYLHIIQPVMYEVGNLWEQAKITVAHEHLASAIVGRVMASISMIDNISTSKKGRAIIASSANELHEIGAWMISDVLEQDGWDVRYLGANMPEKDLIELLASFKPHLLALSVTMPYNINLARTTISQIKSREEIQGVKIMLGGRVFNKSPELWRITRADGYAPNLKEARELADQWWSNDQ